MMAKVFTVKTQTSNASDKQSLQYANSPYGQQQSAKVLDIKQGLIDINTLTDPFNFWYVADNVTMTVHQIDVYESAEQTDVLNNVGHFYWWLWFYDDIALPVTQMIIPYHEVYVKPNFNHNKHYTIHFPEPWVFKSKNKDGNFLLFGENITYNQSLKVRIVIRYTEQPL